MQCINLANQEKAMVTISQLATTKTIRLIIFTTALAAVAVPAIGASEKLPADTPLIQACLELEKEPTDTNWERVLGLATALKGAIDRKLGRTPYTKPIDLSVLRAAANSTPGRHTLLNRAPRGPHFRRGPSKVTSTPAPFSSMAT